MEMVVTKRKKKTSEKVSKKEFNGNRRERTNEQIK
jgi:hypothetical protein